MELDKPCFQHGKAYGDYKELPRRTTSNKVLRDKTFNLAKNPKYDQYQRGFISLVYKYFDKNTSNTASNTNKGTAVNPEKKNYRKSYTHQLL